MTRCAWCGTDPLYVAYHDTEWGVAERRDAALWEKLVLDGFQAGLSWITILRRRERMRQAFANFDPGRVAAFGEADVARLMAAPGVVHNRAKIVAAGSNARAYLRLQERGSFATFLWDIVGGTTRQNDWARASDVPTQTGESVAMARALKGHGFAFCGPVTCYAFMQATGMVNDHVVNCPRHAALGGRV